MLRITNIISQSNYQLSQALNKRKENNEIVDRNAGIPEHIKHKSKKFENLINSYYTKAEDFYSTKNLVKSTSEPIIGNLYNIKIQFFQI